MAKPQTFKQLQKKWYDKLKKSGFNDIERTESEFVIRPDYLKDKRILPTLQAKQEYYYMANHFLNSHEFENNRERSIWEYHSNGVSCRNIVKLLKKVRITTNRTTVSQVISRLRSEMKTGK